MNLDKFAQNQDVVTRRYQYGDRSGLAVDIGPMADASVDVVDGTIIVVTDDDQYELDLPVDGNDAHTFIRNGVLTIETEASL